MACIHIGIGEHDVRALAAQFERDALQVRLRRRLHDQMADFGRTGEGDLVDVHVPRDRGAGGRAVARQHIDHAFREAGFHDQFADAQGGEAASARRAS